MCAPAVSVTLHLSARARFALLCALGDYISREKRRIAECDGDDNDPGVMQGYAEIATTEHVLEQLCRALESAR